MLIFVPLMLLAVSQQSEYWLWSALTGYMGVLLTFLTYRLLSTHKLLLADGETEVSASEVQSAT